MPPLKAPPPKPRAGQHRRPAYRGRIEGLGSPAPPSLRASTPTLVRAPSPMLPRRSGQKAMKCSNPTCPNPDIVESEQGLICNTCGAVAQEESGLVSEQGFGETDSGRITALGVHVGESQTHQRTYAAGGALGNVGREPTINRDRSEAHARTIMLSYQSLLGVRLSEVEAGMQIFKLAWSNSFVQGRTIDSVAVVCLYLACRRKREQIQNVSRPVYSLMLIDFAEKLNIDVFALGRMYQDLVRKLYLQPDGSIQSDVSSDLLAMDPEYLVNRFVDELEFDKAHREKIKLDAIRIVQRMQRDWIVRGRRPSGVCGAAVIIAARMNNYRRTTREVVLTAKVTEITINKRLEEFNDTASSKLSVTQFRDNALRDAQPESFPPAWSRSHNPKEKKKRGRPRKHPLPETAAEIEGDATTPGPAEAQEPNDGPPPAKRVRIDADGYKIPDIPVKSTPIDPALEAEGPSSSDEDTGEPARRRQRAAKWKAPPASPAEVAIENEIEQDIAQALRENGEFDPTQQEVPDDETQLTAGQTGSAEETQVEFLPPHAKDKTPGPAVNTRDGNMGHVSLSPTLKPDEFDSDDDVSMCLLSEEESRIKERVWVSMNADWLRQDHAKRIKRELKEADMRARGLDPAKEALKQMQAKGKRKDGTKKPGRRGDVSYLHERDAEGREKPVGDGAGDTEGADGVPISRGERERSAAESVRKMFKTRGVYSRRVNYDVLDSIYGVAGGDSADASPSRSHSVVDGEEDGDGQTDREGSVASSTVSTAAAGLGTIDIFRGNGQRDRYRSRSSLAGEKKDSKRKENAITRGTSTPDREGDGENENTPGPQRHRESSGRSPEPQQAEISAQDQDQDKAQKPVQDQLPSPPQTQAQSRSQIPSVVSSSSSGRPAGQNAAATSLPKDKEADGEDGQQYDDEDDEDDDDDDSDEDDEDEDDYENYGGRSYEDVDAAFEGRYGGGW